MNRLRHGAIIAFDIGAPIALYYVLRAAGLSVYLSLLISAVLPVLSTLVQIVRGRKLDQLGIFMAGITILSAGVATISGSDRFLLAKDGWVTAVTGLWMLSTTRSDRPIVYHFARVLLEGRIGPKGESWASMWDRLPRFRRVWRVACVIWGVATLLDAGVRVAMAYTLPVNVVPALNGVQYLVLFLLLQIATNIYYFRAGLFNPQSALYQA
ncbi:VC0807 family protein [Amycolatopsis sp. GM8]|uniref:VC0807 family protein n=1 Tax=Amycolatopsis sp. GM8 TaxID=2896530 RepID=UPI001F410628|nr:VC0807 family protein [Amycolatopsis sp. GM8]